MGAIQKLPAGWIMECDEFLLAMREAAFGDRIVYAVAPLESIARMSKSGVENVNQMVAAAHIFHYGIPMQRRMECLYDHAEPNYRRYMWEWIFFRTGPKASRRWFQLPAQPGPEAVQEMHLRKWFDERLGKAVERQSMKRPKKKPGIPIDLRDLENYTGAEAYHADKK